MSLRASRRALGKSHPAILRARLDALTDNTPPPRLLTPPAPPAPNCSEEHFQLLTEDLAAVFGWWLKRDGDSRRTQAGWPDSFFVKPGRAVGLEYKTQTGKVRPEQRIVIGLLATVPGVEARIVRPSDWDWIVATLTKQRD